LSWALKTGSQFTVFISVIKPSKLHCFHIFFHLNQNYQLTHFLVSWSWNGTRWLPALHPGFSVLKSMRDKGYLFVKSCICQSNVSRLTKWLSTSTNLFQCWHSFPSRDLKAKCPYFGLDLLRLRYFSCIILHRSLVIQDYSFFGQYGFARSALWVLNRSVYEAFVVVRTIELALSLTSSWWWDSRNWWCLF
jgi:hypothetical protein